MAIKQAGMAMVVAMLILSIVTVFAARVSFDYQFNMRRISNQMLMGQAYQYLLATEEIAKKALLQDLQDDADNKKSVDDKSELWAKEDMVFTVDDGAYTGKLTDLQGRFNLNSLKPPSFGNDQYPPEVPYTISQGIFMRLLLSFNDENFSLSINEARAITEAVMDWLDADNMPTGFNCGEDNSYRQMQDRAPHRVANGPFYSVSELRLICNMPIALYLRLRPYVTVWPLSGDSTINLNTAGLPILRSLLVKTQDVDTLKKIDNKTHYQLPEPLTVEEVKSLLEKTQAESVPGDTQEIKSATELGQNQTLAADTQQQDIGFSQLSEVLSGTSNIAFWPNSPVGLSSNWFLLDSSVTLGKLIQTMSSVLSRENGTISVVERSQGGL